MNNVHQVAFGTDGASIPAQLRELASSIEDGVLVARTVFVVVDGGPFHNIDSHCFGYLPRKSEAVGTLAVAALDLLGVER